MCGVSKQARLPGEVESGCLSGVVADVTDQEQIHRVQAVHTRHVVQFLLDDRPNREITRLVPQRGGRCFGEQAEIECSTLPVR